MRLMFSPRTRRTIPSPRPAKRTRVPSLIAPWTTASIMYCTDCHDNDTGPKAPTPGTGPSGPHGSSYQAPARWRATTWTTVDTTESAAAYALCYKCHNRNIILSEHVVQRAQPAHQRRTRPARSVTTRTASAARRATPTNNAFLINFDTRFVTPSSSGILRIRRASAAGSARCYLTCHGENHNPISVLTGWPRGEKRWQKPPRRRPARVAESATSLQPRCDSAAENAGFPPRPAWRTTCSRNINAERL